MPRSPNLLVSLRALELATRLYQELPGVTVSLRVIEQDILEAAWLPSTLKSILELAKNGFTSDSFDEAVEIPVDMHFKAMTREQSFSCVAMFESGHFNIKADQLTDVIALCYEDSIFVSAILISDPQADTSSLGLYHRVGNIGHAGMALMISPPEPRIQPLEHDASMVEHRPYDYEVIDSLKGTSLHLSFTAWKMPLDWENTGDIDQDIFLIESVVSVQFQGRWVADIDVLGRETSSPDVLTFRCDCELNQQLGLDLVSLDSWQELLDLPPCVGVLRANTNWVARLAATSILIQRGQGHQAVIVDGSRICWACFKDLYSDPEPHFPSIVIY
jgi:hypothetical protein